MTTSIFTKIKTISHSLFIPMALALSVSSQALAGDDLIFQSNFEDLCADVATPPGLVASMFDYVSDLNDGIEFGVSTNTDVLINLFNTNYGVVSNFTYPDTPDFRRRLDFVSAPTSHNSTHLTTLSVSQCPGDFSEAAACTRIAESFRSIMFSNDATDNPTLFCILEPGKTYYLNVINSSSPYAITPSCGDMSDSNCALFFTETAL